VELKGVKRLTLREVKLNLGLQNLELNEHEPNPMRFARRTCDMVLASERRLFPKLPIQHTQLGKPTATNRMNDFAVIVR
jgi:hypothetical protein